MVRWVVGSILQGVDPYFSFQPVLHDWSNKGYGMCYPVGWCIYKRTHAVNVAAAGFLSHYLSSHLPYVRRHITVNKNVLSATLNKTSFLPTSDSGWSVISFTLQNGA